MKKILLLVTMGSVLLWTVFTSSALVIYPGMEFRVKNETYTVNTTMVFDQITISDTFIVFNETGFSVLSPNSIMITLVYIGDHIPCVIYGETVVDFSASTTSGTVWLSLSGFPVNNEYLITRNAVNHSTNTANGTGVISFSTIVWDLPQRFEVFLQTQTSGESTPPQISGMTRTTSDPLDTSPTYGWVNVCGDFSTSHDYTVPSGVIDSSIHFVGAHQALFIEK